MLNGGVTFYSSDVQMKNVIFNGSEAEDALNIIDSQFTLSEVSIRSTDSGGFSCDFSSGIIRTSSFNIIGGNATNFTGCDAELNNDYFSEVRGVAVSAGESGNVYISKCAMKDVGIGVAVKDGSLVTLKGTTMQEYQLSAAVTYQEKSFYNAPQLMIKESEFGEEMDNTLLRQAETIMKVDGHDAAETNFDTRNLHEMGLLNK
ncbi:hypothetical protein GKODMF_08305 [Candidatus Electrothrix gigas]